MTNRKHRFEPLGQNPRLACKICGFGIGDHFTELEGGEMTWQTEFDKKFTFGGITGTVAFREGKDRPHDIKAFIQDLLDRKVREIEGLKDLKQKSDRWRYSAGEVNCFNQALDQALSILKEK